MRSEKDKKDRQGLILIAAAILSVGGVLIAKAVHDRNKVSRDEATHCPSKVTRNTVIVIDQTERMTLQTQDAIKARAKEYVEQQVEIDERVSVFAIRRDSREKLMPLFSMCRPPSDGNRLIEGVKQIKEAYASTFARPLDKALAAQPGEETQSPIAQVITDLTLTDYLRGTTNTLLVFSDMLEHTDRFSLYSCMTPDSVVERYKASRLGSKERPTFKNVAVNISYVPRRPLQAPAESKEVLRCRDKLWTWFFGDNSGPHASLALDYLPGDPASEKARE